ncbi:MAG: hypothetical protein IJU40_09105, partial [Desulfovibrionaceae bacterium]|nr:hypothetical protein [Desulfovibrionaceae bacterium]
MTELCVLHANCQGDVLRKILQDTPSFSQKFHIHLYTNYTKQVLPPKELNQCALFLYQKLDASWGDLASEKLLAQLSPKCQAIQIPNMFFKGYWPFWTNKITEIDFADTLLEKLWGLGLSTQNILKIYLQGMHPDFRSVKKVAWDSLKQESD